MIVVDFTLQLGKCFRLGKVELAYKPVEEWDYEELARGHPRGLNGKFAGKPPAWLTRQVHEEIIRRFQDVVQQDLRKLTPKALKVVERLMTNQDTARNGRYIVPPSVQLQAAQWVVEHLVGKPTQRIEADISVRLQAILGQVLVSPEEAATRGLSPAHRIESIEADAEEVDE